MYPHKINMGRSLALSEADEILDWCEQNAIDLFGCAVVGGCHVFRFESETDAMMFVLRWC